MPKRSKNVPKDYIYYKKRTAKVIGGRIKLKREKLGLSQEQLRVALQLQGVFISRSQFSRLESGEILPSALEVRGLTLALNVSYSSLLDDGQILGKE
jgi:transcriptional regulator with XRE-family HTH domain